MNTINIKAESEIVEPSIPEGLPYVSVDITVTIDHKEFGTTFADAEVIDGYQLLATRHAGEVRTYCLADAASQRRHIRCAVCRKRFVVLTDGIRHVFSSAWLRGR